MRARRKTPPRKKKASAKPKSQRRVAKLILIIFGICALSISVLWLYVRQLVEDGLQNRNNAKHTVIAYDRTKLYSGQKLSTESLLWSLNRAGLYERRKQADQPNSYYVKDGQISISLHDKDKSSITFTKDTFYSDKGNVLSSIALPPFTATTIGDGERRRAHYTPISGMPKHLIAAVLAIEDQRFYTHFGIDLIAIGRALAKNVASGGVRQGGSTITQQLAKNLFLSRQRSLTRKILEALAAINLELKFPKEKILEMYLNEIFLGQDGNTAYHGFPSASEFFFGKKIGEITIAEAALLAGMIKAPSGLNPARFPEKSAQRKAVVLKTMHSLGLISQKELKTALAEKIVIKHSRYSRGGLEHYFNELFKDLSGVLEKDALGRAPITVNTTVNPAIQRCAENAIVTGLAQIEQANPRLRRLGKLEAALLAAEPYSGKVRAWVGGRDYNTNQFDHVRQAVRPIGSTIKPFVYLTALDPSLNSYRQATTISLLADEPVTYELLNGQIWEPKNYDKEYNGEVTLRHALEHSLNLATVYLTDKVGVDAIVNTIKRFKISDAPPAVLSIGLGTVESSLFQLVAAYGALANSGIYVPLKLYNSYTINNGSPVSQPLHEHTAASSEAVYILTDILRGVLSRGTGAAIRRLGFQSDAAGKTGTTNDARDAWFVGYTPDLVAGVWIGLDNNREINLTGGGAAAPIWAEFMKCAAPYHADIQFVKPRNVVSKKVDLESGLEIGENCGYLEGTEELFITGSEPGPC